MALTNDTVMLFLLLMPGFLSSIMLNMLIVRKPPSGLLLIIEALVFSFVIYVCWGLLSGQFLVTVGASGVISPGVISRRSLVGVVVFSVLLPLGLSALLTHDYLFRALEWLKVTRRTGRTSVWLDVFVDQQRCVIVNFTDGRRLFGWPEYYSDDVNEGMLYLASPAWIDDDQRYIPLTGMRGFLISKRESIESVMFTDVGYNNADVGYDTVGFQEYGEQSSSQARISREGAELSSYLKTGGRAESTTYTDKASSSSSSPSTEKTINQ
jgi:hypothetical protein